MLVTPALAYSLMVAASSGTDIRITKEIYPGAPAKTEFAAQHREPGPGSAPNRYKFDPTRPNLEPLIQDCERERKRNCRP